MENDAMNQVVLELSNVCKNFSAVEVLKDVSFTLKEKNILGLVGENGAGKSTLMNILGGIYFRSSGEMNLYGQTYNPRNPDDAKKAGVAFIHQELNLFTNLSIAENIFIDNSQGKKAGFISFSRLNTEAKKLLTKLNIKVNPRALIKDLPMGIRQMVEIAKAIAKNSRIIIFDEPTTSLSSNEKEVLFSLMRNLSAEGVSMIYISHALDDVIRMCDEIVVLRDGQIIGNQEKTENITKDTIIKNMVGREMSKLYPYTEKKPGAEIFAVRNITKAGVVDNITFRLNAGRITGMFGLMGAGRSELANIVFGVDRADSGEIILNGKVQKHSPPNRWIDKGVAYITENRRDDGLLLPQSVKENLILVNMDRMKSKLGVLNYKLAGDLSGQMQEKLHIKTFSLDKQPAGSLSGGNQQKVVIGKWLMVAPRIFILDEPTRGVDVGAKYEIYTHINNLADEGSAVLFISSEMEELIGVCDSIIVMSHGQITGEVQREDFSQELLMKLAIGE
jgi:ABC-type sugar transport system ATPase subunit